MDFGEKSANLELIIVTSPHCKYCKEFHPYLFSIIKNLSDSIYVRIVFDFDSENELKNTFSIYEKLVSIYINSGNSEIFMKALDEWYNCRSNILEIKEWENRYDYLFNKNDNVSLVLDSQSKWQKINEINFTPVIFINGYRYPVEYDRRDLEYFVSELIEQT